MALATINPHMVTIQIHVRKNLVDDVLLDEGFSVNNDIEDPRKC